MSRKTRIIRATRIHEVSILPRKVRVFEGRSTACDVPRILPSQLRLGGLADDTGGKPKGLFVISDIKSGRFGEGKGTMGRL